MTKNITDLAERRGAVMASEPKSTSATVTATQAILLEVEAERKAQVVKWGVQDHPIVGGCKPALAHRVYAERADDWKVINDQRVKGQALGWDSILIEEVYEALGADSRLEAREELIQVAAVAVAAIEALDRQNLDEAA